jgi:hypothetical protein
MRAVLLILIAIVVAIIIAVATGFVDIDQVRGARAPEVSATGNGLTAKGGQPPAFEVETGSIKVGTEDAKVKLPSLQVAPPDENEAATNNAM